PVSEASSPLGSYTLLPSLALDHFSIIGSISHTVGLDCLTRIASVAIRDVTPLCYFCAVPQVQPHLTCASSSSKVQPFLVGIGNRYVFSHISVRQLQALVDKKRVIVTESSIKRDLHLDDAEGTDCLPTATIFEELARMGYEKPSHKLTFYKAFFSPQWKYFIHTITQCLSAKSIAWNEFSKSIASLIICLATNQKFNLSKYIFDAMVLDLQNAKMLKLRRLLLWKQRDPEVGTGNMSKKNLQGSLGAPEVHPKRGDAVEAKVDGKNEQSTKPDDSTAGEAVLLLMLT
ncbi:hypothetical protein Tco_0271018, partial [Tanacetum coccineum]